MTASIHPCPACREPMAVGFLLDETYGNRHPVHWVEGPPERSIWTGLKIKGTATWPVTSYRCTRCGFLASYATETKQR